MNKPRASQYSRRSQYRKSEKDNKNLEVSHYDRFAKTSKFLPRVAAVECMQLRKPLNIYMIEELRELSRKTYFQRVYVLALNVDDEKLREHYRNLNFPISESEQPDFCEYFQRHLLEIFSICERKKSTADHLSGLFIAMGANYTYLMIEGAEDMIANFFEEFELVHDRIWASSRVFLVEDKIGETYFNSLHSRRAPAININEKFPPSTPNEYKLMAVQHLKLKEKAKNVAETLSIELKKTMTQSRRTLTHKSIVSGANYLPADPYNKLLPEIQRIDLVLNANKFYRTVKDYSLTYRVVQTHQDEDSFFWPIKNNYMPLEIFERSPYDVNLTFGDYGKEDKKETQENASHDMLEREEEEP